MDQIEDLEKLKQLKDNGTITEKEFEEEKQKLLNSNLNKGTTDKKATKAMVGFILGLVGLILSIVFLVVTLINSFLGALMTTSLYY